MTANQIAYQKYLEEVRHNVSVEEMDRPVKEAQALQYTTAAQLNTAKVKTESLNQDILNIQKQYLPETMQSQIDLNRASATERLTQADVNRKQLLVQDSIMASNYAAAYQYQTGAELNIAKTTTESYNTQIAQAKSAQERAIASVANSKAAYEKAQYQAGTSKANIERDYYNSDVGSSMYSMSLGLGNVGSSILGAISIFK